MKPISKPLLAAGVAFWLWSAPGFAEAAQPLCEIYEPAELLAHWGYPIEVELWVEDPYEAYRHADFYNYLTGGRGVDREELQPLPVPYRVGALTIVSADDIEWHVEPAVVASAYFLSRTTRIGIEYDDRIGINWKHIGWRRCSLRGGAKRSGSKRSGSLHQAGSRWLIIVGRCSTVCAGTA